MSEQGGSDWKSDLKSWAGNYVSWIVLGLSAGAMAFSPIIEPFPNWPIIAFSIFLGIATPLAFKPQRLGRRFLYGASVSVACFLLGYVFVWKKEIPIRIVAMEIKAQNPQWQSFSGKFTEIDLIIFNEDDTSISDLDLTVFADGAPLCRWSQKAGPTGVELAPNGTVDSKFVYQPAQGESRVMGTEMVATTRGVRVLCSRLQRKQSLGLTFAAAVVNEAKSIEHKDGVIRFDSINGTSTWVAMAGYTAAIYLDKPTIKSVRIKGSYVGNGITTRIDRTMPVANPFDTVLRQLNPTDRR